MQKVIFLVDMNAFFIGCEMTRHPDIKGKPAAVAGDPQKRSGIILAANYDARKFGVKTTMVIHEAKKLCPNLILVPPDHAFYEKKSNEVMNILSRYSPVIQQNSIDEAWLDVTGCETLFGKPRSIAERIMKDIMTELGLWCSIGISENKFLSKMASEIKKPLGITEVWLKDVREKIWPLPVREMYGIGKQTEKKLNNLALFTIGDLACCNKGLLAKTFGKYGEELHRLANGMDLSPVLPNSPHDSRSISRSTTLPKDVLEIEYARAILLSLAEEVGREARRSNSRGRTIAITIKYSDFKTITRQKSVAPTYLTREIYRTAVSLLESNWGVRRPVRLLGVSLSNFDTEAGEQLTIFDVANDTKCVNHAENKEEKLERAMDQIKEKYGFNKIKRAGTAMEEEQTCD